MPFIPPIPLINGNRLQFASVKAFFNGLFFEGFKSISYSQEKAGSPVYGASVVTIGMTRGQLKPELSFEMFKEEYDFFCIQLMIQGAAGVVPSGYMDVRFPIVCSWAEQQNGLLAIVTETIPSCRIKKDADDHSEGTDALTVKVDCDVVGGIIRGNGSAVPVAELVTGV